MPDYITLPDGQLLDAYTRSSKLIQLGMIVVALDPQRYYVTANLPKAVGPSTFTTVDFACRLVATPKIGRLMSVRVAQSGFGAIEWTLYEDTGSLATVEVIPTNAAAPRQQWEAPDRDSSKLTGNGVRRWLVKGKNIDSTADCTGYVTFYFDEWTT